MSYYFDGPFDFVFDTRDYTPSRQSRVSSTNSRRRTSGRNGSRGRVAVPMSNLNEETLEALARQEFYRQRQAQLQAQAQAEARNRERAERARAEARLREQQRREAAYRTYLRECQAQWDRQKIQQERAARAEARARREREILQHVQSYDPFDHLIKVLSPLGLIQISQDQPEVESRVRHSNDTEPESASHSEQESSEAEPAVPHIVAPELSGKQQADAEPEVEEPLSESSNDAEEGEGTTVAGGETPEDTQSKLGQYDEIAPTDIAEAIARAVARAVSGNQFEESSPVPVMVPKDSEEADRTPLRASAPAAEVVSPSPAPEPVSIPKRSDRRKAKEDKDSKLRTKSDAKSSKASKSGQTEKAAKSSKAVNVAENDGKRRGSRAQRPRKRSRSGDEDEAHLKSLLQVLDAETQHLNGVYQRLSTVRPTSLKINISNLHVLEDAYQRAERVYTQLDGLKLPKSLRKEKHDLTTSAVDLADRLERAINVRRQQQAEIQRSDKLNLDWSDMSEGSTSDSDNSVVSGASPSQDAPARSTSSSSVRHHVLLEDVDDESDQSL